MNLRQFDLNLLIALDVLLTERNVTRAAERLFLSQSAMSGMLARLRHAFADELLVRVGRNFEPTEFAASIAGRVHDSLLDLEDLLDTTQPFDPASDTRAFRISASDCAVLLLFGPILQRLAKLAPKMSAHFLRLGLAVGEHIASGEIDFAVLPAEVEPSLPSLPISDCSKCRLRFRHCARNWPGIRGLRPVRPLRGWVRRWWSLPRPCEPA